MQPFLLITRAALHHQSYLPLSDRQVTERPLPMQEQCQWLYTVTITVVTL